MPSIRGYSPGRQRGEHSYNENVRGENIENPDGVLSGMTRGLAIDGEPYADVSDMPPDTRNINPLPVFDPDDVFLED